MLVVWGSARHLLPSSARNLRFATRGAEGFVAEICGYRGITEHAVGDDEMIAFDRLDALAVAATNVQRPTTHDRSGGDDLGVEPDPVTELEPVNIALQVGLHLRAAGHMRVARRHRELRKAVGAFAVLGPQPGVSTGHAPYSTDIGSPVEDLDLVTRPAEYPRTGQPGDTRPHYRDTHPNSLSNQTTAYTSARSAVPRRLAKELASTPDGATDYHGTMQ
jgi:hypothetical protein